MEGKAAVQRARQVTTRCVLVLALLELVTVYDGPARVAAQRMADQVALSGVAVVEAAPPRVYLPMVSSGLVYQPVPDVAYTTLPPVGPPTDRPAEAHPDLNLAIRDYALTDAARSLVDYGSPGPGLTAPQLSELFGAPRMPVFSSVYRVHDWDWVWMQRGDLLSRPPVTALGMETGVGEVLYVPDSGYEIGSGCEVLVLYASLDRITLKYTREDNVIKGYTLHVEQILVEPGLVILYQECNRTGRSSLPALRPGQAFGRARGTEVIAAIRDSGAFMDPRSRGDWWLGY